MRVQSENAREHFANRLSSPRSLPWIVAPLLAVVAYAPALQVGFLADDLILLNEAQIGGIHLGVFVPHAGYYLYRPIGSVLTWQLGWQLWDFNALPYHVISLALYAGVSLLLGLWVASVSSSRPLGWLAGALFAVFPAHLEAVAWIAAQWDLWAAFFGLFSLWLFAVWVRRHKENAPGARVPYVFSLLFFLLGVFSKESLITFFPVFILTAWLVEPRGRWPYWKKLGLMLLPFAGVLVLNVGLRLFAWGSIGGYQSARTDYLDFVWDATIAYGKNLLAPVNSEELGIVIMQMVGIITMTLLMVGLIIVGRRQWRMLLASGVWIILALIPVLNLFGNTTDLRNNRLILLASAGYCIGVAALLLATLDVLAGKRSRRITVGFMAVLLSLGMITSWLQLRPWQIATEQVSSIDTELQQLIPATNRPQGMLWYVQNRPELYHGAYVYINGLGNMRYFTTGDTPAVAVVQDATAANLFSDQRDAFAMTFELLPQSESYRVAYLAGVTSKEAPPSLGEVGAEQMVWDFTQCMSDVVAQWQPVSASAKCEVGKGLILAPSNSDPQLIGPEVRIQVPDPNSSQVRIRAFLTYPQSKLAGPVLEWFWRGSEGSWSADRSRRMSLSADGRSHVYWTFVPGSETGGAISDLRLDPINSQDPAQIQWIAVDVVK